MDNSIFFLGFPPIIYSLFYPFWRPFSWYVEYWSFFDWMFWRL